MKRRRLRAKQTPDSARITFGSHRHGSTDVYPKAGVYAIGWILVVCVLGVAIVALAVNTAFGR